MRAFALAVVSAAASVSVLTAGAAGPRWTEQNSGVTARFRGISAVSDTVVWASGNNGTIVRTIDGGKSWQTIPPPPDTQKLDFRDVDAVDRETAYVLSIGPGEASRIFKTSDGGRTWQTQFVNRDEKAFFDAMVFSDARRGVAVSDSIDGRFVLLLTTDGGAAWTPAPAAGLPPALPNEGAFAASGTNLTAFGARHVWLGTGAAATARVLRSSDGGKTWSVAATPLPAGPSAGIFSIAFRDTQHGVIVGGDYKNEAGAVDNVAVTSDGGATWTLVKDKGLSGFRSVVTYIPRKGSRAFVAVGPSGADLSTDDGRSWQPIEPAPGGGFHTFSIAPSGQAGWGAGEKGRIARLDGLP